MLLIKYGLESRHKYASQHEKQCTDNLLISIRIWIFVTLFSINTKSLGQGNLIWTSVIPNYYQQDS